MQITYLVRFVFVDFNMIFMMKFEKRITIIVSKHLQLYHKIPQ